MRVKSVEFKNFASYGNRVQRIDFEEGKGELFLVLGSNGAGKSSLAKVITYLCYGRVDGSNLKDLPNRVNGELWGRIRIESKGNHVEIERGINPGVFNVMINGTEYDVAGKTNIQEFLENEIFEIPYHVFKNVIILSVNDFKSFVTMSNSDKKAIVDRIFGFSVINEMREIIKQKRKALLDEIRSMEDEIRTLGDSILSVEEKIKQVEKSQIEKDQTKIKQLKERLKEMNSSREKLKQASSKLKDRVESLDGKSRETSAEMARLKSEIGSTERALKLYENRECPTCHSALNTEFHHGIKAEKETALQSMQERIGEIEKSSLQIEEGLGTAREQARQVSIKTGQLEAQMNSLKEELIKIANEKSEDSSHLSQLAKDFSKKMKARSTEKLKSDGDNYYLSTLESILGDDGIKNLAIRSILPSFNNNIMLMGKEMGIPFGILFDEKFNCVLYHLGEEISPRTLSTGEKKKVDFVIIMALIKMIKNRFPGLNILFLDEIFSSIDSDGVYHIIDILHQIIREVGINTFVINHTVLPSEYFDKKVEITKDGGFSEFSIEAIG
jgi:DNA repair exonuclease SbcCD ATPase subunit